ncbi:hypothetical protein U9M48_039033 [Paspalum notatum var. saurae]|uniref:Uncharacterized protein n=1 Tax=Paspalum notatum var. saurae TaxID=547442 RepID=A0AAQ3XC91_PASNO
MPCCLPVLRCRQPYICTGEAIDRPSAMQPQLHCRSCHKAALPSAAAHSYCSGPPSTSDPSVKSEWC